MKQLKNQDGSILSLVAGLVSILIFAVMGSLNVSYLLSMRFQLQSELDALALQLVQQVDYENYFETGFTDSLGFDLFAIDQLLTTAGKSGAMQNCGRDSISSAISGLSVTLELTCPIRLPFVLPGIVEQVDLALATSARLAQVGG
jgi:hypothetical protein